MPVILEGSLSAIDKNRIGVRPLYRGMVACHTIFGAYAIFIGILSDEQRISTNPFVKAALMSVYVSLGTLYLLSYLLTERRDREFTMSRAGKFVGLVLVIALVGSLYSKYVEGNEVTFLTYGFGALFYFITIILMRQSMQRTIRTYKVTLVVLSVLVFFGAMHLRFRYGQSGFQEIAFLLFGAYLYIVLKSRSVVRDVMVVGLGGLSLMLMMKNTIAVQFVMLSLAVPLRLWLRGRKYRPFVIALVPLFAAALGAFVVGLRSAETFSSGNLEFRQFLVLEGVDRFLRAPIGGSLFTGEPVSELQSAVSFELDEDFAPAPYHNDYVTMAVGGGILGLLAMVLVHIKAIRNLFNSLRGSQEIPDWLLLFSAVLTMAIPSLLFNPVLYNIELSMVFWPLAAIVLNANSTERRSEVGVPRVGS